MLRSSLDLYLFIFHQNLIPIPALLFETCTHFCFGSIEWISIAIFFAEKIQLICAWHLYVLALLKGFVRLLYLLNLSHINNIYFHQMICCSWNARIISILLQSVAMVFWYASALHWKLKLFTWIWICILSVHKAFALDADFVSRPFIMLHIMYTYSVDCICYMLRDITHHVDLK